MNYEKITRHAISISALLSLLVLVMYALIGFQIRMVADDYCSAILSQDNGPLYGALSYYQSWGSRYATFFIQFAVSPLQPTIHLWMPIITLGMWIISLQYLLHNLQAYLKLPIKWSHLLIINVIVSFTFYRIMPSYQHAFWFSAQIAYTWSILIATIWLASISHFFAKRRSQLVLVGYILLSGLLMLMIGGLVETVIPCIIAGLALMLIGAPKILSQRRREYLIFIIVTGIFALLALAISVLSPGSWARRQLGIETEGVDRTLIEALWDGSLFSLGYTFGEPFGITFGQTIGIAFLSSLFLMGFIVGLLYFEKHPDYVMPAPKNLRLTFVLSFLASAYLIFSVIYPAVYAARGSLPLRPLILPRLIQLFVTIFWLYLALAGAQRHNLLVMLRQAKTWSILLIFLSALFIWTPSVSLFKLTNLFSDYQAYAQSWDERHELLLNAEPGSTVIVPPLTYDIEDSFVLQKLDEDPTFWINGCVAGYYNLESVALESVNDE